MNVSVFLFIYCVCMVACVCVFTETCGSSVCSWGARCIQNKCECPQCAGQPSAQVCGTDGMTYTNECELLSESCRQKKHIEVARHGSCDEGTLLIYIHITVSLCVRVCWSVPCSKLRTGAGETNMWRKRADRRSQTLRRKSLL